MKLNILPALVAVLFLGNCGTKEETTYAFKVADLEPYIIKLSGDEFMGRMPFTEGEKITTSFLESEFKTLGLEPGNGDSYFQDVPMVSIKATPASEMKISSASESLTLEGLKDYVIWTQRTDSLTSVADAELIFAGFGIVAPEYGWDDYKNIDVKGKVVVVMVNDPGFGTEDVALFKGNTMTY